MSISAFELAGMRSDAADWFNTTCTIKRVDRTTGGQVYSTAASNVACRLDVLTQTTGGQGNMPLEVPDYQLYVAQTTDLRRGDRVEVGGTTYTVQFVMPAVTWSIAVRAKLERME